MVDRYAIGLFMGVLLAAAAAEVPFAMGAGARPGARATGGVHPGLRPEPGAHFRGGRHFPVVHPGGINPGVGRSFAVPIPRLSVPLPHHVIVVGAGPLFWPQVYYRELFGYLFPHAEIDGGTSTPFWTYGYEDLIGGLFWPYFGFSVQILEQRAEASARLCLERAENVVAFPLAQIKQEVLPTAEQQAKLELAKATAALAANAFKSSCSAEMPLTPVGRLDSLAKRLAALAEVMNTLRPPLQSFYDSLADTQKAKLDAMGRAANRGAQGAWDQETSVNAALAQLCSEQNSRAVDVRTDDIEKALHPDETQNHALESLHDAWNRAADLIKGACPREAPVTTPGRMEAVEKRLAALLDAIKTVRLALVTFYGLLSDEQKARFNLMAPPPTKASDACMPRVPRAHRSVARAIV
jgi:hypothetical protein